MRTIKGTKSVKAFKAVRSLEPLELDEVIYQTAMQAINTGDTWEHGEAVRLSRAGIADWYDDSSEVCGKVQATQKRGGLYLESIISKWKIPL